MNEERKKFEARFTMMDKRRRQMLFSVDGTYLTYDRLMVFEDYLHISIRRKNSAFPLMQLQLHLLQDLVNFQKVLSELKGQREKLQRHLADHPEDKAAIEAQMKDRDREINVHEVLRRPEDFQFCDRCGTM